ncbi:hypothetical protein ACFE04_013072 [Oxalis oulophora]
MIAEEELPVLTSHSSPILRSASDSSFVHESPVHNLSQSSSHSYSPTFDHSSQSSLPTDSPILLDDIWIMIHTRPKADRGKTKRPCAAFYQNKLMGLKPNVDDYLPLVVKRNY